MLRRVAIKDIEDKVVYSVERAQTNRPSRRYSCGYCKLHRKGKNMAHRAEDCFYNPASARYKGAAALVLCTGRTKAAEKAFVAKVDDEVLIDSAASVSVIPHLAALGPSAVAKGPGPKIQGLTGSTTNTQKADCKTILGNIEACVVEDAPSLLSKGNVP